MPDDNFEEGFDLGDEDTEADEEELEDDKDVADDTGFDAEDDI